MSDHPTEWDNMSDNKRRLLMLRLMKQQRAQAVQMDTIPTQPREGHPLPLSFAQQRLWYLDQLEPNSPAYNLAGAVQLTGHLRVDVLEASVQKIVSRHEVLRTTFPMIDDQPIQCIAQDLYIPIRRIDLCTVPADQTETEVQRLSREEANAPFDLTTGPLMRVTLLQTEADQYVLLFNWHHIIVDGWSITRFVEELAGYYTELVTDTPSHRKELPIQYADYAVWQRQQIENVRETQLAYWRQQLHNSPKMLKGPGILDAKQIPSHAGAMHSFLLEPHVLEGLQALTRKEGATLYMTLLAAYTLLLSWQTGEGEVTVGSPISGRTRVELEEMIGLFLNTIVLRTSTTNIGSFRELVGHVREVAQQAYKHQDVPFEMLVEALETDRSEAQTSFFQSWFVFHGFSMPEIKLPGVSLKMLEYDFGKVRHDIKLGLWEIAEGLRGVFEYRTERIGKETIQQWAAQFTAILETVVRNPDVPLHELTTILNEIMASHQKKQAQTVQKVGKSLLKSSQRKTMTVPPIS